MKVGDKVSYVQAMAMKEVAVGDVLAGGGTVAEIKKAGAYVKLLDASGEVLVNKTAKKAVLVLQSGPIESIMEVHEADVARGARPGRLMSVKYKEMGTLPGGCFAFTFNCLVHEDKLTLVEEAAEV